MTDENWLCVWIFGHDEIEGCHCIVNVRVNAREYMKAKSRGLPGATMAPHGHRVRRVPRLSKQREQLLEAGCGAVCSMNTQN
jgi:hypothetical protein